MPDSPEPKTGRTYADAAVEVMSSWRLAFLLCGSLLLVFFVVHLSAEPGSTIELLGVAKYQKAKAAPASSTPLPTAPDETATYLFPKNAQVDLTRSTALPILDGTLAIKPSGYSLQLQGDSVNDVQIAARRLDGTSVEQPYKADGGAPAFDTDVRLEIEFRKRYFAVEIRETTKYKMAEVTVIPIVKPTLKLKRVADLPVPRGD